MGHPGIKIRLLSELHPFLEALGEKTFSSSFQGLPAFLGSQPLPPSSELVLACNLSHMAPLTLTFCLSHPHLGTFMMTSGPPGEPGITSLCPGQLTSNLNSISNLNPSLPCDIHITNPRDQNVDIFGNHSYAHHGGIEIKQGAPLWEC